MPEDNVPVPMDAAEIDGTQDAQDTEDTEDTNAAAAHRAASADGHAGLGLDSQTGVEIDRELAPMVEPLVAAAGPEEPPGRDAVWPAYAAILVCLAVAAMLASARIVSAVERQPQSPLREPLLAVGTWLHQVSSAVYLDRPYDALDRAFHPPDDGFVSAADLVDPEAGPVPLAAATRRPTAAGTPRTPVRPTRGTARPSGTGSAKARPVAPPQATRRRPTSPPKRIALPPGERPPPPPAEAGRVVSLEAPLKLLVAGDSMAQPVAYELQRTGADSGLMTVDLDYKLSSGVSRPDFFDWPTRIAELAARGQYDALVFNVGGNDTQSLWTEDGWIAPGSREWQIGYAQRAGAIMDSFRGKGITVYWIGLPVLRDEDKNVLAKAINAAVAAQAARRLWVRYVDTWPLFVDAKGGYNAYLPDATGEQVLVRQTDGVHLTREGTRWVTDRLSPVLASDWHFPPPPSPTPSPTATSPATATPDATSPLTEEDEREG
jgi:hypothetical protein